MKKVFQNNNMCSYSTKNLQKHGSTRVADMRDPSYFSDITVINYHIFGNLKNYEDGQNSNSLETVKNEVSLFFDSK